MGDAVDAFTMDSASYTDLTVDQVKAVEDAKNETSVSYTVLDAAGTIESNIPRSMTRPRSRRRQGQRRVRGPLT